MLNIAFAMKAGSIFFRAEFRSARLEYILSEILERRLGLSYSLVHKDDPLPEDAVCISYGLPGNGFPEFPDSGILRETSIKKAILSPDAADYALLTDQGEFRNELFGAAFFLLSLYLEQSRVVEADVHGRFPDTIIADEKTSQFRLVDCRVGELRRHRETRGFPCRGKQRKKNF